ANLESLVESFGKPEANQVSHKLIHLGVNEGFTRGLYMFASDYVVEQMYTRIYVRDRQQIVRFISASTNVGDTGVLRGIMFERFAHQRIPEGGTFKVRKLEKLTEQRPAKRVARDTE